MQPLIAKFHNGRQRWVVVLLLALALYVLVPQLGDFRQSLGLLRHPRWGLVLLAVSMSGLTYVAAAGTYCFLAFERLSYGRTLLVQLAGMFINRLLPVGVGALGVSYAYLRRSRHTKAQAATVVTVNNSLGFFGHLLLSAVVLALFHSHLPPLHFRFVGNDAAMFWGIVALVVVLAVLAAGRYRLRLGQALRILGQQLGHYRRHPLRLAEALGTSVTLTVGNIVSLWLCLLAVHGNLPFVAVLVVFTFGVGLGNATPTPGGLGGIEAGLVAAFVAYHVSSPTALAAVLLYRLISYWLALAVGALAFVVCQQRGFLVKNVNGPGGD